MTINVPLAVRLRTSRTDLHITNEVHDLSFRSVSPGGFASCTVALDRPLSMQPDEIATYGRLYIYDTRTGATVWEGRLEDPGRTSSDGGQIWSLTAIGPSAHVLDRTIPLTYVDQGMDTYLRVERTTAKSAQADLSEDPGNSGADAMVFQFPEGMTLTMNDRVTMRYWQLYDAGMKLASFNYNWDAGITSTDYEVQAVTRVAGVGGVVDRQNSLNVAAGGSGRKVVVTDFTNGNNTLDLRLIYLGGGGSIGADTVWVSVMGITTRALLMNADGTDRTTGYTTDTVLASEVVKDLLGRVLTSYDGTNANVTTTAYAIDQLAYPDGVTAQQVLEDLLVLEPAYTWHAWESNAADKYRFEWVVWPTTVRYEADVVDGFDSPSSAEGLYNAVRVRWRSANGRIRNTRRTATVPDLLNAVGGALVREALIDLGDEVGSTANAVQAGDQFLAEHATPPNAGTLNISRPIADLVLGRMVMPWEIRPGTLIRVRGVLPKVDSLNATSRDGVTVFKVAAVDYSQDSNTASLELDSYPLSVARAIAKANKRPVRRRR